MTAAPEPEPTDPIGREPPLVVITPASALQRNSGFEAAILSSIGALVYPTLPPTVRSGLPLPTFTLLMGRVGILLQRLFVALWNHALGDIAAQAAAHLRTYVRIRRLQWYGSTGILQPSEVRALVKRVIEADLESQEPNQNLPPPSERP